MVLLYRCRRAVAWTSFLAGSVCWCFRHLYAPRDVGVVASTSHMMGVHAPAGMVSTSPVGDVCPPCLLPVRRLRRHEERYRCMPRDPYVCGAEITPTVDEVRPDKSLTCGPNVSVIQIEGGQLLKFWIMSNTTAYPVSPWVVSS